MLAGAAVLAWFLLKKKCCGAKCGCKCHSESDNESSSENERVECVNACDTPEDAPKAEDEASPSQECESTESEKACDCEGCDNTNENDESVEENDTKEDVKDNDEQ